MNTGHSVLSFDFCYCSRKPGEEDKQTCLVLHDRDTQLVHVIPTLQKGGKSLQYLVTEFVRFIMHTQHREVALRSDLEPANLALADGVRKTCRGLGITVHHEPIARGEHQSNGAVESTLQQIRLKAGILVSQSEKAVGGDQLIFLCNHPVYNWALLHAAWLSNRFIVKQGTTAFEKTSDHMYTGTLCVFGESVLGYIKPDRKGAPRWCKGIWLGKALTNDTHIIGYKEGIFVTRSVRRLPTAFVLEDLGDVTTSLWEYGYAALGHRMMYNRHLSPPLALGMPMIAVEAIQVRKYAADNPNEDLEQEPASQAGQESVLPPAQAGDSADASTSESNKRPDQGDASELADAKKARIGEEQPVTPPMDDAMDSVEERSPKAPKLAESPKQQMMQYEFEFHDDEFLAEGESSEIQDVEMARILQQLTFPFSLKEPSLSADEMMRLDPLADQLELQRLQKLHMLQSPESVPSNSKVLSTRFVRSWREKHDDKGNPIWLRRSRVVAREFAWLEPERESLFSPASGSIISRILPTIWKCVASLDVRDAFLTVKQECPTLVHTTDAGGNVRSFALGRVLPGQRDGSLLWYKAITNYLKTTLDLEDHAPYPCVLKSKDNRCIVMIHVDDLLVAGRKSFVLGKFAAELRKGLRHLNAGHGKAW